MKLASQPQTAVTSSPAPRWAERIMELVEGCRDGDPDLLLPEMWVLLNGATLRYMRLEQRRLGPVDREDLQDIAATKAVNLMEKARAGKWDPLAFSANELRSMIATVARNGLIDHLRIHGPTRRTEMPAEWIDKIEAGNDANPHSELERRRVANQLRQCAKGLTPRARKIWIMRVFLDLSSKEIALHPTVQSQHFAVDVALARARTLIRTCMRTHGYSTTELPAGLFPMLWETFFASQNGGERNVEQDH